MAGCCIASRVCVFAGRDEGDVQGDERQPGAGARARQRLLPGAAARQGAWRQGVDRGLDATSATQRALRQHDTPVIQPSQRTVMSMHRPLIAR